MIWNVIRIHTTNEATDYLSEILYELGFKGIEVKDNVQLTEKEQKAMFIDFLPEVDENDRTAIVTCYTDADIDPAAKAEAVKEAVKDYEAFVDFGDMTIEFGTTEDKDWINNWKKYFKSFYVDEGILIKPTWEKNGAGASSDLVVEIDPGTAFGTGAHETTAMVIRNLRKVLKPGERILDLGTGSGILSIIAMKLGAQSAVGIDIDANAVSVAAENAVQNGLTLTENMNPDEIGGKVCFLTGDVLSDQSLKERFSSVKYPIVVANILADVIIPLAPIVRNMLLPDGIFISSGIINTKAAEVKETLLSCGYEIITETRQSDWVCYTARMPRP